MYVYQLNKPLVGQKVIYLYILFYIYKKGPSKYFIHNDLNCHGCFSKWALSSWVLLKKKGCSLPSTNINKSKIIQNNRILVLDASASSDLVVTCDCGHSLRFTPPRWRRGQTSTWQGLRESHNTCCQGDGCWRTWTGYCYFSLFFLLRLN